jgi:hypothetical protein
MLVKRKVNYTNDKSQMDTPDKLARYGTQEKLKQTHNTDSTKKQG